MSPHARLAQLTRLAPRWQRAALLGGAFTLLALALALAAIRAGDSQAAGNDVVIRAVTVDPTVAAPQPPPGDEDDGDEAPDGPPAIRSLAELAATHGDPPGALGRLRIPLLGVDAPIGATGVGGDGVMPNPAGPSDVQWYDFSGFPGFGGPIGGGNAVFAGHVDYAGYVPWADARYRGEAVFAHLGLLSAGDRIEVEWGGERLTYTVQWQRLVPAADSEAWAEVLSAAAGDVLTILTCGGEFNSAAAAYLDRIVVRAVRG